MKPKKANTKRLGKKPRADKGKSRGPQKPAALKSGAFRAKRRPEKFPPEIVQAFIIEKAGGRSYRAILKLLKERFGEGAPKCMKTLQRWNDYYDAEIRAHARALEKKSRRWLLNSEEARQEAVSEAATRALEELLPLTVEQAPAQIVMGKLTATGVINSLAKLVEASRGAEEKPGAGATSGPGVEAANFIRTLARAQRDDPEGTSSEVRDFLDGVRRAIANTHPELADRLGRGGTG